MKILGIPETVGLSLTQVGTAEGHVAPAPRADCPGSVAGETGSFCVNVSVPTKVNLAITVLGVLGVNVPTTCETSEPITFNLAANLTVRELIAPGPHFTGTTTLPPIVCSGLEGPILDPVMTALISGPDNAYALSIGPQNAGEF
jgi:hypothetical protein